jgi:hypothetical protein
MPLPAICATVAMTKQKQAYQSREVYVYGVAVSVAVSFLEEGAHKQFQTKLRMYVIM